MKPGDLVRFKDEFLEAGDKTFLYGVGMILSLYTERYDQGDLFEVLMDGRMIGAFEHEIELINEAG
jgi:hypothetical protein